MTLHMPGTCCICIMYNSIAWCECNALAAEKSDVLMQEPRAGVLRPSFCLVRDEQLHCIVLAIRGTHSLKVRSPFLTIC